MHQLLVSILEPLEDPAPLVLEHRRWAELHPRSAESWMALARAADAAGQTEEARAAAAKALALVPPGGSASLRAMAERILER